MQTKSCGAECYLSQAGPATNLFRALVSRNCLRLARRATIILHRTVALLGNLAFYLIETTPN